MPLAPNLHAWDCVCGIRNAASFAVCRSCRRPASQGKPVYAPVPVKAGRKRARYGWIWGLGIFAVCAIAGGIAYFRPSLLPSRSSLAPGAPAPSEATPVAVQNTPSASKVIPAQPAAQRPAVRLKLPEKKAAADPALKAEVSRRPDEKPKPEPKRTAAVSLPRTIPGKPLAPPAKSPPARHSAGGGLTAQLIQFSRSSRVVYGKRSWLAVVRFSNRSASDLPLPFARASFGGNYSLLMLPYSHLEGGDPRSAEAGSIQIPAGKSVQVSFYADDLAGHAPATGKAVFLTGGGLGARQISLPVRH